MTQYDKSTTDATMTGPKPDMDEREYRDGAATETEGETPRISFDVAERWDGGFLGEITITNATGQIIEDWSLDFDTTGFSINDAWGGDLTVAGNMASLDAKGWTTDIASGQATTFGFAATGTPPSELGSLTFEANMEDGSKITLSDNENPDSDTADEPPAVSDTGGGTLPVGGEDGAPFGVADYDTVLNKSMQFYYANYAGDLPEDHPISWRWDSTLDDGAEVGRDLSGGLFDAGDHVKFGLPMAGTATTLAWGGLAFEDGYKDTGAYDALSDHLRQLNDYFLNAYDDKGTADLSDDVFHAQVGDGNTDHAFWGAPEDMTMDRPVYSVDAENPGTEVTAQTAAAMAASSMFFREKGNTDYADELLDKAVQLFEFSETYQGEYTDTVTDAAQFYNSWSGYEDELSWSANWLYQATGDDAYLQKSIDYYVEPNTSFAFGWDNMSNGTTLLLAQQTGEARYVEDLDRHLDYWMEDITTTPGTDTNDGLAWVDEWGSNRYAANTSLLATVHAKNLAEADASGNADRVDDLLDFATDQLDFMMGDNPEEQSFVVGFGEDFPRNPHHRGASGTTHVGDSDPNAYILQGALVGGPDQNGDYNDVRSDYVSNEVATDYNAGFSGALAGVYESLTYDDWM
ncbi:glycoside hydrolase family 9 protein [Roseobacter weihaiensis]|uniref:glycoside hydrolase family 9 protein n=1 Tax=Roseobacter weihaiensis TaxID=2763262 RepID=UPI001D0B6BDC|nr:glycoside hydrolase family 9 protein [Roseobacter sp. H9]